MTKEQEALKLALEALTYSGLKPEGTCDVDKAAIAAIKEALAQPAQRPWVGLTEEEIDDIFWQHESRTEHQVPIYPYERAIEAKLKAVNGFLKEKNFD
jgi:hypothetical protein